MPAVKPFLYLPIEIKVRDFDAKMLLACAAAREGYRVIIGRKTELMEHILKLPPGIFLGMWAQGNFAKFYRSLKQAGFATALTDEEGVVTFYGDGYQNLRLSHETMPQLDLFTTWGQVQKSRIENFMQPDATKVVNTGNLRFDILRPELRGILQPQADELRRRHGNYILMTTSFGTCNHFMGQEKYYEELKKKKITKSDADEEFLMRYHRLKAKVFPHFTGILKDLSARYPDHKIIVRPHPSEHFDTYKEAAAGCSNVEVIHEGNVHPWLLAAKAVIHHYCTTALEAYALGTPSIGYRPQIDEGTETDIVYRASLEAHTANDVMNMLDKILQDDLDEINQRRADAHDYLKSNIENLDGNMAFENILENFKSLKVSPSKKSIREWQLLTMAIFFARRIKRTAFGRTANYLDHKTATLEHEEIHTFIDHFQKQIPGTQKIKASKSAPFCFEIIAR